ncbi:MAG: site-2 protease family protein [Candidatus Sulfopaludibacter sp.]|nr:site-2 protease family protein [Candidatus Sulfopaludibacter sp.]
MTTLVDSPDSWFGEWHFRIFGIPVRVTLWFWLVILLIGGEQGPGPMAAWITVCFVSILLHELGHVCAFRLFRERAEVVLYGWGGLTIPQRALYGTLPRFVVALAGPFTGFLVAGATLLAANWSGASVQIGFHLFLPVLRVLPRTPAYSLWYVLINDLLWVNVYWGLINLLPVHPLDGGHAARAVFEQADPANGPRKALILSAIVSGGVAFFAVLEHSLYLTLMFTILAVSSLQLLDSGGARTQAYRSPRR